MSPHPMLRMMAAVDLCAPASYSITPGLRFDYHEIGVDANQQYLDRLSNLMGTNIQPSNGYENFSISPRLDAVFETTEHTRVYAGYGMGIRNPTAEELTMVFDHPSGGFQQVTIPNPDLKEEVSHAVKAGYKGEKEIGRFAVEGFFTKYEDYIENNVPVGFLPDGTAFPRPRIRARQSSTASKRVGSGTWARASSRCRVGRWV